jgi:type VI secretion system protein ImpH
MATQSGTEDTYLSPSEDTEAFQPSLETKLIWIQDFFGKSPGTVEFFQAVRILSRLGPGLLPPGLFPRHPNDEVVRFAVNPAYWFPPSQISSLDWNPPETMTRQGKWNPPVLRVNFFGMVGPQGVLPLVYSDFINERLRNKDRTMLEFFDIFHHRMISFFYQAWEKYRFYVSYERDQKDRLAGYLMNLVGLGTKGLQKRQNVKDTSLIFYTGLLAMIPRSAMGLEQLLSDYFRVPVSVEAFAGAWYPLEESDICQFNDPATEAEQLGFGVVVGDAVWDRSSRARIRIGPLKLAQYKTFLPGGPSHQPLHAITNFFSNGEIIYEVQLLLERNSVPACNLGIDSESVPMLGWLTWMNSAKPRSEDPGDTIFQLN